MKTYAQMRKLVTELRTQTTEASEPHWASSRKKDRAHQAERLRADRLGKKLDDANRTLKATRTTIHTMNAKLYQAEESLKTVNEKAKGYVAQIEEMGEHMQEAGDYKLALHIEERKTISALGSLETADAAHYAYKQAHGLLESGLNGIYPELTPMAQLAVSDLLRDARSIYLDFDPARTD